MLRLSLLLIAALSAAPVAAETLSGRARVIDGDTIEIAGERIRLYGIDAPELSQTCRRSGGQVWRCGQWAKTELQRRVERVRIRCEGRDRDRYGRLVAVCYRRNADLNAELVRNGIAFAYQRYSLDYVDAEKLAAVERRGVWDGEITRPAEVRAPAPPPRAQNVPANCPIKGNISNNGRIYHLPEDEHYSRTRIDTSSGERWFCSEAEARAAGWRHARR